MPGDAGPVRLRLSRARKLEIVRASAVALQWDNIAIAWQIAQFGRRGRAALARARGEGRDGGPSDA